MKIASTRTGLSNAGCARRAIARLLQEGLVLVLRANQHRSSTRHGMRHHFVLVFSTMFATSSVKLGTRRSAARCAEPTATSVAGTAIRTAAQQELRSRTRTGRRAIDVLGRLEKSACTIVMTATCQGDHMRALPLDPLKGAVVHRLTAATQFVTWTHTRLRRARETHGLGVTLASQHVWRGFVVILPIFQPCTVVPTRVNGKATWSALHRRALRG